MGNDKAKPANTGTQGLTKRLIKKAPKSIGLPEKAHRRFKTACSATSRKMTQEIETFVTERIAELEKEAGITRK